MARHKVQPLVRQAATLLESGRLFEAEQTCRQALAARPRDDMAMALLAQTCHAQRSFGEAESWITEALKRNPRQPDYHTLHAEVLATQGRFGDAIDRFDQALRLRPTHAAALAGKGTALLRLGDGASARTLLEKIVRRGDPPVPVAVVYARALVHDGDSEEAITVLEGQLPADSAPLETRRSLWFTLGRAREKSGLFDAAFDAYQTGNDITPVPWDADASTAHHTAIADAYPEGWADSFAQSTCSDESPIFIVGMLRSGSTLTEQIIDAHPAAQGLGELETLPELARTLGERLGTTATWPACAAHVNTGLLDETAAAYLEQVRRLAASSNPADASDRLVDKQLGNYQYLGLIAQLFPKARIIHCRRHPMDLGVSVFAQRLPPGTNGYARRLADIGRLQRDCEQLMAHWKAVVPSPILDVRYEDLVADLDGTCRGILEFCGLPWSDDVLRFWETGRTVLTLSQDQVRQPLYKAAVGRHRHFGGHLDELRASLGDAVEAYEAADTHSD